MEKNKLTTIENQTCSCGNKSDSDGCSPCNREREQTNDLLIKAVENCCVCNQPTQRDQLVLMPSDDVCCKECYHSRCWHDRGNIEVIETGFLETIIICHDCEREV